MKPLDPVDLTRRLVDIESLTYNEGAVGAYLDELLQGRGFAVERTAVPQPRQSRYTGERFNLYAGSGEHPDVVLSTHMDTVPPFIPSSEDDLFIYGRGSCDAKGIIAAQLAAAERLRDAGVAKGALRAEIRAFGTMAHSAYPELGESAVHKLVHALERLLALELPSVEGVGPSTLNIGLIHGGHAPNVIADIAGAQVLIRLVGPSEETRRAIEQAVAGLAEVEFTLEIPFIRMREVEGLETMVAAFTTDIPALTNWGEPLLLGPGSIHVAHTPFEKIAKRELLQAVDLYFEVAKRLAG
jgi:acetylornithine deacetylase